MPDPSPSEIKAQFEALRNLLDQIEEDLLLYTYVGNLKDRSKEELAEVVANVKEMQDRAKLLFKVSTEALGKIMSADEIVSLGSRGEEVEKKRGTGTKGWQHAQLKSLVIEYVLTKHRDEDGALDAPPAVLIAEAFEFASINAWRKKALREAGIVPEKYSVKGADTTQFVVRSNVTTTSEESDDDGDDDFYEG